MKKTLIISESQYGRLTKYINEGTYHRNLVKDIVEDLNKNYKKAIENYEDKISGDFRQRKVFEVNASGDVIDPLNLSNYIQKKYNVGKKFTEQVIKDWCDGNIKDGLLSSYISSNE